VDYLDFDLEIQNGGPEKYPLEVDSPGGHTEAEMHWQWTGLFDSTLCLLPGRMEE
jgi:hypothetical protein